MNARLGKGSSQMLSLDATTATQKALLATSANSNGNANSDVAEVDFHGALLASRLAGSDNRSPLYLAAAAAATSPSSGSLVSSSSSRTSSSTSDDDDEPEAEEMADITSDELEIMPGSSSPVSSGNLPPLNLPNMTSPPFGFEFACAENSPDAPSSAKLHPQPLEGGVSTGEQPMLTAITPSSVISPSQGVMATTQFFPQSRIIIDPRSSSHMQPSVLVPQQHAILGSTSSQLEEEDDEEPRVCLWNGCQQGFPNLGALVSHLDRGHTLSMTKYVCLWRGCQRDMKPFDARYKLTTHLRCHTGEKPYRCDFGNCNRSFSRLENLKLHIRTHTGEKPYVCHYEGCSKRFNNTSDRAKHMKTHITRKPYACKFPGCGKSYTDPSSMRKHVKYTHKLKERQAMEEEMGSNGGSVLHHSYLHHHHGGGRKPSTASTSSSSTPSTPQTPTAIIIQKQPNILSPSMASSPVAPTISLPPNTAAYLPQTIGSISSPGQTSAMMATPTRVISVPLLQLAGQTPNQPLGLVPGGQQILMSHPPTARQHPILMFLPTSTSAPPPVNGTSQASHKAAMVSAEHQPTLTAIPIQTVANPQQCPPLASVPSPSSSSPQGFAAMTSASQREIGNFARRGNNAAHFSEAPSDVEQQLRLQIAHLQQQLYDSQQSLSHQTSQHHHQQQQQQQQQTISQISAEALQQIHSTPIPSVLFPCSSSNAMSTTQSLKPASSSSSSSSPLVLQEHPAAAGHHLQQRMLTSPHLVAHPPSLQQSGHLQLPPQLAAAASGSLTSTTFNAMSSASGTPMFLSTAAMPICFSPGQAVLPQFVVPTATGAQVIPLVQSQGVATATHPLVYMTPNQKT